MLYPRFIVTQKRWLQILQICCAAQKTRRRVENINARISYLPTAAAAAQVEQGQGERRGETAVAAGSSIFHLAGIVCQTQNFVFSHSRRRRHVRGLWIITLKTAEKREWEQKRERARESHNLCERRFYRTFYFPKASCAFLSTHFAAVFIFA